MEKRVAIIGGGFSGLVTAYFCQKQDFHVSVYEASGRWGGALGTDYSELATSEWAANGIINSSTFEALCEELDVPLIAPKGESKARYIFKSKARRWPLGAWASLRVSLFLAIYLVFRMFFRPKAGESLQRWGYRSLGQSATHYLLEPAFQGIYAGDLEELSASLLLSKVFSPRQKKKRLKMRGTVCPKRGMGQLVEALVERLKRMGAELYLNHPGNDIDTIEADHLILACGPRAAAKLVAQRDPELSELLNQVEMLSLVSVSMVFAPHENDPRGFGCLFPKDQNFHSLGVLFQSDIFEHRSSQRSEKWILGGALSRDILKLSDEKLLELVLADRARLNPGAKDQRPLEVRIHRSFESIPHYTTELEELLPEIKKQRSLILVGNYLGRIGLADILQSAEVLARSLGEKNEDRSTTR